MTPTPQGTTSQARSDEMDNELVPSGEIVFKTDNIPNIEEKIVSKLKRKGANPKSKRYKFRSRRSHD